MRGSLKHPPQYFNQVEVWRLTLPQQHIDFLFSRVVVDLLLRSGSLHLIN